MITASALGVPPRGGAWLAAAGLGVRGGPGLTSVLTRASSLPPWAAQPCFIPNVPLTPGLQDQAAGCRRTPLELASGPARGGESLCKRCCHPAFGTAVHPHGPARSGSIPQRGRRSWPRCVGQRGGVTPYLQGNDPGGVWLSVRAELTQEGGSLVAAPDQHST